MSTLFVKQ